jgi:hypothetical protein
MNTSGRFRVFSSVWAYLLLLWLVVAMVAVRLTFF